MSILTRANIQSRGSVSAEPDTLKSAPHTTGAKLRLAYLTSVYPAVSHTFIHREISALRDAGVPVQTFSIRTPPSKDPRSKADEVECANTFYLLPLRPLGFVWAHLSVLVTRPWRYARTLFYALTVRPRGLQALLWHVFYFFEAVYLWYEMRRRDIDHVHVHFAMACATVANIAWELGHHSFSMTVHGPTVFYDASRHFVREKVRRACMVVCISDFCRSQVMSLARPQDWSKLKVIHCGVDPTNYVPKGAEPRSCPSSIRLLNVARLSPVKGHAVLLEAIALLRTRGLGVTCTIVGDGPEGPNLKLLSTRLGIQDQVRFAGSVSQDDIQCFYDEADVFVLPSFAEGVPVVLMEAMAKELPVVSSRTMGIPELVEHGVSGLLVPPGRVEPLVDAISILAMDAALRQRMGTRGREKVCSEFDVRSSADQLARVFQRIVSTARNSSGSTTSSGT